MLPWLVISASQLFVLFFLNPPRTDWGWGDRSQIPPRLPPLDCRGKHGAVCCVHLHPINFVLMRRSGGAFRSRRKQQRRRRQESVLLFYEPSDNKQNNDQVKEGVENKCDVDSTPLIKLDHLIFFINHVEAQISSKIRCVETRFCFVCD